MFCSADFWGKESWIGFSCLCRSEACGKQYDNSSGLPDVIISKSNVPFTLEGGVCVCVCVCVCVHVTHGLHDQFMSRIRCMNGNQKKTQVHTEWHLAYFS